MAQSSSTSSRVPSWFSFPMVSGQRVMSESPASSRAARAAFSVPFASSRASARLSLAQEPVWTTTRSAPRSLAAAADSRMYRMLPWRFSSSVLEREM